LTSAFLGAKYQVPAMIRRGGGSLIFTSSFVCYTEAAVAFYQSRVTDQFLIRAIFRDPPLRCVLSQASVTAQSLSHWRALVSAAQADRFCRNKPRR
jgi:hypothetical protein